MNRTERTLARKAFRRLMDALDGKPMCEDCTEDDACEYCTDLHATLSFIERLADEGIPGQSRRDYAKARLAAIGGDIAKAEGRSA